MDSRARLGSSPAGGPGPGISLVDTASDTTHGAPGPMHECVLSPHSAPHEKIHSRSTPAHDMLRNSQCRESSHPSAVPRVAYPTFSREPPIPRALVDVATRHSVELNSQ